MNIIYHINNKRTINKQKEELFMFSRLLIYFLRKPQVAKVISEITSPQLEIVLTEKQQRVRSALEWSMNLSPDKANDE